MSASRTGPSKPKFAALPVRSAFGFALIATAVLPAVLAGEASGSQVNGAPPTAITAAATNGVATTAHNNPAAADTSPACPDAYLCLQSGPDPLVPYGTDPDVPYGTNMWNSRVPFGRGSSSYTGGAF
jgi:hypothetical protein